MTGPELAAAVHAWLAEDPDPETRAELTELLARGASAELTDRFADRLGFGTAGLRGPLGAGPNRMNRVVVRQTTAGIAAYLRQTATPGPVVIGYDARHGSAAFAADAAAVLTGAGRAVLLLPRPLPTPVLAFAVRRFAAAAGVMVTASHNPAQDNGYKVYLADGAQLAPPVDGQIAAAIDRVGPVGAIPLGDPGTVVDEQIVEDYLGAVIPLLRTDQRRVRVAYTPLHGVGGELAQRAFRAAGFPPISVVADQQQPDPDFPTVSFPNPEEPGAMDRVIELARAVDADVAIANDPDADRCAVAVPAAHGWRTLSGDEVGVLLADHLLRHTSGPDRLVVTTIVSSSLLRRLAAAHAVRYAETLTGFKWIARAAGRHDRFLFGYEEALGYSIGGEHWPVHDKDGISAALAVAELAALARHDGTSLTGRLDALAVEHGLHATSAWSLRLPRVADRSAALDRLRSGPPATLGGRSVTRVVDLASGHHGLPPTEGLLVELSGDARVVVRPSGTEPKLKAYLQVVVPADGNLPAARRTAATALSAIQAGLAAALG